MRDVTQHNSAIALLVVLPLLVLLLLLPGPASGQEEVASAIRRYKDRDVQHRLLRSNMKHGRVVSDRLWRFRASGAVFSHTVRPLQGVRVRTRLADSHQGIKFYNQRRCEDCHIEQTRDIHTTRANLTCRQCHGGEPVASIQHYYSVMNPIRKHAYICSKCHQGSSASFASYIVHEPAPGSLTAKKQFPVLYYAYWFMLILFGGTMAFFIPHSLIVGFRELFMKKKERRKWRRKLRLNDSAHLIGCFIFT